MIAKALNLLNSHRLLALLVGAGLLLLPLIIFFFTVYGKTVVEVVAAPSDAQVAFNERSGTNGTNRLEPGEYTLVVSRAGFESFEETITVGEEPLTIPVMLTPVSDEAWELVRSDAARFFEVEALFGEEAQAEGERFQQQHPIVQHLPFRSLIFSIDYKTPEDELILIITADNAQERDYALAQIRNWGFDPSDYQIEYQPR